jgi:2-polyprenyl-3-methyl-5-hydroxy-6-metoxy-1,4-benzoquinol methylase
MVAAKKFMRWNFNFSIDGEDTLDPVKDAGLLRRIENRKRLFMEPMIRSGFLRGKRVLDLGSNSGYWSLVSSTEGGASFVRGVEAGPELCEQAKYVFVKQQVDPARYEFVLDDAYRFLEQDQDHYDVILCLGFFYHINDPVRLLQLMSRRCKGVVVIDTVVHNSPEALISVRPVGKKFVIDEANITLELVSSPKAIAWMGEEVGLKNFRVLRSEYDKVSSMWDYLKGERGAYVLSSSVDLDAVFHNAQDPGYLTTQQDLKQHGYFPEMKDNRGVAGPVAGAIARSTARLSKP